MDRRGVRAGGGRAPTTMLPSRPRQQLAVDGLPPLPRAAHPARHAPVGRGPVARMARHRTASRGGRTVAAATAAVGIILASAVGSAAPASAGLVNGVSLAARTVLARGVVVPPDENGAVVLSATLTLRQGQTRRISDHLTVMVSRSVPAEIDNEVECVDRNTGQAPSVSYYGGTNHVGSGVRPVTMYGSLLFTAPYTGTFLCRIHAFTSYKNETNYHLLALAGSGSAGTWLDVDNFTSDRAQWWQTPVCDPKGTDGQCVYLGRPVGARDPVTTTLYLADPAWTAAPNATVADLTASMQITSCYIGTGSCRSSQWGGPTGPQSLPFPYPTAVFRTHLELIQLNQYRQQCRVIKSPDTVYTITNDVHHFLVHYVAPAVFIDQTCGGSRQFILRAMVTWLGGNTVKIDSGSALTYHSSTNASIIVRATSATTTVPNVTGIDRSQVAARLAAAHLTVGATNTAVNSSRPGTVLRQNSPAGTVEPIGSPVDLTISAGAVTVPYLESKSPSEAARALAAAGLGVSIAYTKACLEPGRVLRQSPAAGTVVAPASSVRVTVDSGTTQTCVPLK